MNQVYKTMSANSFRALQTINNELSADDCTVSSAKRFFRKIINFITSHLGITDRQSLYSDISKFFKRRDDNTWVAAFGKNELIVINKTTDNEVSITYSSDKERVARIFNGNSTRELIKLLVNNTKNQTGVDKLRQLYFESLQVNEYSGEDIINLKEKYREILADIVKNHPVDPASSKELFATNMPASMLFESTNKMADMYRNLLDDEVTVFFNGYELDNAMRNRLAQVLDQDAPLSLSPGKEYPFLSEKLNEFTNKQICCMAFSQVPSQYLAFSTKDSINIQSDPFEKNPIRLRLNSYLCDPHFRIDLYWDDGGLCFRQTISCLAEINKSDTEEVSFARRDFVTTGRADLSGFAGYFAGYIKETVLD